MRPRSIREGNNLNGGDCIPNWPASLQSFWVRLPHESLGPWRNDAVLALYKRALRGIPKGFNLVAVGELATPTDRERTWVLTLKGSHLQAVSDPFRVLPGVLFQPGAALARSAPGY